MARKACRELVGIECGIRGTTVTGYRHDGVNRATASQAADSIEPFGVQLVADLVCMQYDRVTENDVSDLGQFGGETLDEGVSPATSTQRSR